jgi:subtilisin family serine protease
MKRRSDAFWERSPGDRAGSDWGPLVDVVAPAEYVPGLNGLGAIDSSLVGTSFSAPLAAGVAGLLMAFDSRLTPDSIRTLIIEGAERGGRRVINAHNDTLYVLDAYEALRLAARATGEPL